MQGLVVRQARLRRGEPFILGQIGTPHRAQIVREGQAADDALGCDETLSSRTDEMRPISGAQNGWLRAEIDTFEVDMGALVDRQQDRRHCDIDVLASAGLFPVVQGGQNRDDTLHAGIEVSMR